MHTLMRNFKFTKNRIDSHVFELNKRKIQTMCKDRNQENSQNIRSYEEIPGPKSLPLIGNSWRFLPFIGKYKLEHVDLISKSLHEEYGDIVKIEGILGRPDMVFLYDSEQIEKVLRNEEMLPYRPSMPSLNYYKHVLRKNFFGNIGGLIAVHGDMWLKFRTKIQYPLLQPKVVKPYITDLDEIADSFISRIRKFRNADYETTTNFLNEIHLWSLESLAKVALNVELGCLREKNMHEDTQLLINAINVFFKSVGSLELKIPFWKFFNTHTWNSYVNSLDTIVGITSKYVSEAMENQKLGCLNSNSGSSIIHHVLMLDDRNPKLATILALDMFLVGIDTTSAAVASILYQLSKNPDKQNILADEIRNILPNLQEKLTIEKLNELRYLKAVIKETLRMYPVVIGNGRCLTKAMEICGYQVPEGVQVIFQHLVISNSERYFVKAEHFMPERWLEKNEKHGHAFASLPFGFGKRMCLGRRLAELEIQAVITKMVQNFHIDHNPEELEYSTQPMYMPNGPLRFTFTDR